MSSSNKSSSSSDDECIDDEMNLMLEDEVAEDYLLQLVAQHTSRPRRYIHRDREAAHDRLMKDYFVENSTYGERQFRRQNRIRKELFIRIVNSLEVHSHSFQQRRDATERKGFTPFQKCTVAIRQLAYGGSADHYDECLRVAESIGIECLQDFCKCVIEVFGNYYLRKPTANDVRGLMRMHEEKHGFSGMFGSLDCMHWEWKNCPVAWKGQYTRGDIKKPTIMLEAVASQNLWIWHAYFGVAGSNNDINVLGQSPLFNNALQGFAPTIPFTINGTQYSQGYCLTDGIYPEWAAFVKSFSHPQDAKRLKFKQIPARKDVERAFGVLQARWALIKVSFRLWYRENLKDIMLACIILHNMIIDDEEKMVRNWIDDDEQITNNPSPIIQGSASEFKNYLKRGDGLRDKEIHHQLRADLVEHIWAHFGNDE